MLLKCQHYQVYIRTNKLLVFLQIMGGLSADNTEAADSATGLQDGPDQSGKQRRLRLMRTKRKCYLVILYDNRVSLEQSLPNRRLCAKELRLAIHLVFPRHCPSPDSL